MNSKPVILFPEYLTIRPSLNEVGEIMGYSRGSEPSFVPEMLGVLLEEAPVHVSAGGCYCVYKISEVKVPQGQIVHSKGSLRCGSKIARQILGSEYFALFITTAGNSFDAWIKNKGTGGDVLAEYLCSSIGSVIADKVADLIQEEIRIGASNEGRGITNRYSPGYCSWNIRGQKGIFDLLPSQKIGVELMPSFLMKPIKSVSGIIGIGKDKVPGPYMCDMCNMTNCLVKKAKGL
jgi:hypothetical protein